MRREDLLFTNMKIVGEVTRSVVKHCPNCVIIVVSNPLDAMAYLAYKVSKFPRERVVGMAGILDTARFRTFLAQELNVSVEDVSAYVLGSHGGTMVPLVRLTTVGGISVTELLPREAINRIVQRTRDGGADIVKLLKAGSAFYAPSAAVAQMVDAIILDKKQILPCAAYLQGEYGLHDVFVGVPVKLGAGGVEEIIDIELTSKERSALAKSADAVKAMVDTMRTKEAGL
ncbi:MAG: malate dehydrogenase, partial [Dehalococcoidia bacterium]